MRDSVLLSVSMFRNCSDANKRFCCDINLRQGSRIGKTHSFCFVMLNLLTNEAVFFNILADTIFGEIEFILKTRV